MNSPDLESRIQMLLDGELSAGEFAALEAELLENPEALETYRTWIGLHCGRQRQASLGAAVAKLPVVPIDRVLALQRQRTVGISLLAAAAVLFVSAVALWIKQSPPAPHTLAGFRTAPGSSFTLTHSGDGKRPTDGMLAEGSRIVLDHGVAELDLPHDVRAIIEAPATLTLIDERTVDLGTAFGVDLPTGSDQTHLHVFTGSVRIEGVNEEGIGEIIRAPMSVAIRDQAGNRFAGISEDAPWRFSTSKE